MMNDADTEKGIEATIESRERRRRWLIPLSIIAVWYLWVLVLMPRITHCGPAREYMMMRAYLRYVSMFNPASPEQTRCAIDTWASETKQIGYEVSVVDRDSGWSIICHPNRPYVYVDSWLHAVLFLERRRLPLHKLRFDFPEKLLITGSLTAERASPGEDLSERWQARAESGCDGPNGGLFPDCCGD